MSLSPEDIDDIDYIQPRILKCRRCKQYMRSFDFKPELCDNCKIAIKPIEYAREMCNEYYKRGLHAQSYGSQYPCAS